MLARSVTFSTAFAFVGVHTPPEQLMFFVGFDEITTAASAAEEIRRKVASARNPAPAAIAKS